jgi:hypothetical protein
MELILIFISRRLLTAIAFSYTLFSEVKVLNGITELAKILKERENNNDYSPLIGIIIQLPNLKVRLGDKV